MVPLAVINYKLFKGSPWASLITGLLPARVASPVHIISQTPVETASTLSRKHLLADTQNSTLHSPNIRVLVLAELSDLQEGRSREMLSGQAGRVSGHWFPRESKAGQSQGKVRDRASKV